MASIYWYDLETFGRNPFYDRIAQFAGLRTNDKLEPMGDPLVLYCNMSLDYLPDPAACLLTGITPQKVQAEGVPETEFIAGIRREFLKAGTCGAGYNSIRFDDEFLRNALYRNFYDPYEREYMNGNSRWDLLDVVRTAHDLRPEGINWTYHEDGRPDFTLESLTRANNINHDHAHDALSDVSATISLAKLVYEKQPKLFSYLFNLRKKQEVWKHIDLYRNTPFLHTSGIFTSPRGCSSLVAPLAVDPNNSNCVLCYDLRYNPTPLITLSGEEIRRRIFTPAEELEGERIHIVKVHVNRAPSISPARMADDETARRLGIDLVQCREHFKMIRGSVSLIRKVTKVFSLPPRDTPKDPDLQIYSGGFFRDSDREKFESVHNTAPEDLPGLNLSWEDPRIPEMLWRYIFRNYPDTMPREEQVKWKSFCASRILAPSAEGAVRLSDFRKKLESFRADKSLAPQKKQVLGELDELVRQVEKTIFG